MISTPRSRWGVFRLADELKKLIRMSPVKAALAAIMVPARGIAGRYLIPRTDSYYYLPCRSRNVDLYGALPMQIMTTVDLAAANPEISCMVLSFANTLPSPASFSKL
jgi:hypothetical protein